MVSYTYKQKKFHIGDNVPDHISDYCNYKRIFSMKHIKTKFNYIDALNYFFNSDLIDEASKNKVIKIDVNKRIKVIALQMTNTTEVFNKIESLFIETGWYFFLTGFGLEDSKFSIAIDKIEKTANINDIKAWIFDTNKPKKLYTIESTHNSNSFLLTIGGKNILLDAGFNKKKAGKCIKKLKNITDHIDFIFLSHSHNDHSSGITNLINEFPNTILLCSKTTLDYFVFGKYKKKKYYKNLDNFKIEESHPQYKVIRRTINVKPNDKIELRNGYIKFYFSGHIPGSLMIEICCDNFKFLYTGDFAYTSSFPLTGTSEILSRIPKSMDFILIDGAMAFMKKEKNNKEILDDFSIYFKQNTKHKNHILITADPASTAIVLALTVDYFFQKLQRDNCFNERPTLILDKDCKEYAKILQFRKEDLSLELQSLIKDKMNPFMSALIKYIENKNDLYNWVKKENILFILGSNDLRNGLSKDALDLIQSQKDDVVIITGRPSNSVIALELLSGSKRIIINSEKEFNIQSKIYNIMYPENLLSFHADSREIINFIKALRPKKVGFFHAWLKDLIDIRREISKELHTETVGITQENFEITF